MKLEARVFDEPSLEFGDQHSNIDPRLGLFEAGPLQVHLGEAISVGVVGDSATVEHTVSFLDRCAVGFETTAKKHPNMNPNFPGLKNQNPFRTKFELSKEAKSILSKRTIDNICKEPDDHKAVTLAVNAVIASLEALEESGHCPDVAIVALPVQLIARVYAGKTTNENLDSNSDSSRKDSPNFRGMLKARAMKLKFPTQIVWEDVINPDAKIPQKLKETTDRKIQDEAGRAWNLLTTLYYKGTSKIPWRRLPREGELRTCYVGISFYNDVDGKSIWTSSAQMFDERGRGFILKGRQAHTEARNRHPYMTEADAFDLTREVLNAYKNHHKHYPARVVVLKTSRFREEESDGICRALDAADTEFRDLVWVQEGYNTRVFRDGDYPVLRGTFVDLFGKGLLYTNGSIPYYQTYPGQYVPQPLLICPHECSDRTVAEISEDLFSLTKVNWNSTQMNQRLPIPIRAARKVAEVLKYIGEGEAISQDYSRYT